MMKKPLWALPRHPAMTSLRDEMVEAMLRAACWHATQRIIERDGRGFCTDCQKQQRCCDTFEETDRAEMRAALDALTTLLRTRGLKLTGREPSEEMETAGWIDKE
jgi:hypothetical protein